MEQYIPFPQVIEQLSNLLGKDQSGVFFIATDTNESARLGLTNGRLTHCSFRRLHGQEALEELEQIATAKCSFSENLRFPFRDRDSIDHDAALLKLDISLPAIADDTPPEDPQTDEEENHAPVETRTRIYRGKVIEETVSVSQDKPAADTKKPKKGPRIYRGKIIEDD
ncbi:MAG: hypothetical protein R3F02_00170 [Thiolinea sp.]